MSQSSDDSVEAQVERVYSYLLNYTSTVKGKISLHYLNYIQRKHIKITSKPQKQAHFAVLRPSRREASTTNSVLWLLGVRDQNTTHSNPHCTPVAPWRSHRALPRKAMVLKAEQCTGSSWQPQGHLSRVFCSLLLKQAVTRTQPTLLPAQLVSVHFWAGITLLLHQQCHQHWSLFVQIQHCSKCFSQIAHIL